MTWKTYKDHFQKWLQSTACAVLVLSVATHYFLWKACTVPEAVSFFDSYRFYVVEAVLFAAMSGIYLERLFGSKSSK